MNWWLMRHACDAHGSADPVRLAAVKSLGFRDVYDLHLTQDALEAIREYNRRQREHG